MRYLRHCISLWFSILTTYLVQPTDLWDQRAQLPHRQRTHVPGVHRDVPRTANNVRPLVQVPRKQKNSAPIKENVTHANFEDAEKFEFFRINVSDLYPCRMPNVSIDGKSLGNREYRIVATSTNAYFAIFLNWLYHYFRHCPNTNYIFFVCLDRHIEARLRQYGFKCNFVHYIPVNGAHQRIWLIRGLVVKKLLMSGYDVFLADSDAVWLRNPFFELARFNRSDIIASRASYPEEIYERIGATVCMGFVYFQSNPGMVSLWTSVNDEMMKQRQPDDQRVFNHAIMKMGLYFSRKLNYWKNYVHDSGSFQSREFHYNITLLAHHQFRRHCDVKDQGPVRQAIVAHCSTSAKELSMKQLAEVNFGLWKIRQRWEQTDVRNMTTLEMLETLGGAYS